MKRNDPTFKELIARIQSGELTRAQAAEAYGINLGTLNTWIARSKIKLPRSNPDHLYTKENCPNKNPEKDAAYSRALQDILSGMSINQAAERNPPLTPITLRVKLSRARLDSKGRPIPTPP